MSDSKSVSLNILAGALRVSPHKVVSALTGNPNPPARDFHSNPEISVAEVAAAFGINVDSLVAVLENRDRLLTTTEVAKLFKVTRRTVHKWRLGATTPHPVPVAIHGHISRYSQAECRALKRRGFRKHARWVLS